MKIKISFPPKKPLVLIMYLITIHMYAYSQDNLSKLFESALPSVLKIDTFDSNGNPLMSGTGFFISPNGKAISNLHVFKGASKSIITTSSGKIYKIDSVWYKTDSLDLVTFDILHDDKEIFPFLKMAGNLPKIGDGVFVIGNPIGLDFTVSNGIISSIRQQSKLGQILQTSAPISAGSSGSPLMDMNGFVIGVITYTFTEGQNLNFAISLMDKNLSKDFVRLNIGNISGISKNTNKNWTDDKYGYVRGSHLGMCNDWRFNIEYLKNMMNGTNLEWAINVITSGKSVPLESYVRGYSSGGIIGTTSLFVINKNLAYVISFGTEGFNAKSSLILVSRITNGEASHIFNYVVEKTRLNNTENRFLENVGNSRISILVEDKIYVRSIYLEDHIENESFSSDTFYIKPYKLNIY